MVAFVNLIIESRSAMVQSYNLLQVLISEILKFLIILKFILEEI